MQEGRNNTLSRIVESFEITISNTASSPDKDEIKTIKNTKATLPSSSVAFFLI
jgi:hypothetical protein